MVKEGKESEIWADVTPEMVSEEEKDGKLYVGHPLGTSWMTT